MSDKEKIDELIKQLKHEHDLYKKHLKVYEDENAKLRECVEFYADRMNWSFDQIMTEDIYRANGGKRARSALSKNKELIEAIKGE